MIFFDTETTGLVKNESLPLIQQPRIIEFGAIKTDDNFSEVARLNIMIDPECELPSFITKITGIKPADLRGQKKFVEAYEELCEFFVGEKEMVAHNIPFDRALLRFELERIGKQFHFPWPSKHTCTVELSMPIKGKRMKLQDLYKKATGKAANQTHRAVGDCELLIASYNWLRREGYA